jgi:replicative superfamily II helicase
MPIPIERAKEIIGSFQTKRITNLFAQSDASHILKEVGELKENFPDFDPKLVDKVTLSAYSILSAGVSLAESRMTGEAIAVMEKAATLLNNVHLTNAKTDRSSSFHILVASMAFHASGQYSRAFVSIRRADSLSDLAKLIAAYIGKRPSDVIKIANKYLMADLADLPEEDNLCDHAVTLSVARALTLVLEYFATGNASHKSSANDNLNSALELAEDFYSPSHWWIARLLRLMIKGNHEASMWTVLPPYFPDDKSLLSKYVRLMTFGRHSITELWQSQREAIPIALDRSRRGAVVNMRTSAGKTRIAELSILQTLHDNPSSKILYLAPFRSLALEIEQTLNQIFDWCGFNVSHLYGGFRLSSADRLLAEESTVTIATPEKARAMLRSSPELLSAVKLIIIDEGHLIGGNERNVKNELFFDHLRVLANVTNCRILMLSAVLPNAGDLAVWLTGSKENIAKSLWKPSSERFGLLQWQGKSVKISWKGDVESFNPKFVQSKKLESSRRKTPFPKDKKEAIAATAVRLAAVGPVMIFSARANSIPGLAEAVLLALGNEIEEYEWPQNVWKAFVATCEEELSVDSIEMRAARRGVICHHNKLPSQVRMVTERLMRSFPPKIIIASSTLAQGVNIGVSSVIVSTVYQSKHPIDHRDFWNVCGRAGRAFVDGEGKILYAIDETESRGKIRKNRDLAENYFDRSKSNVVESGLLYILGEINKVSQEAGIEFDQLLNMVAENDFSNLGEDSGGKCQDVMDTIDDGLLALNEDTLINPEGDEPEAWVDSVFRASLASIQAEQSQYSITPDQIIAFIKTRARRILELTPNQNQRKAYVTSGLPMSAATKVYLDREQFIRAAQEVLDAENSPESVITFLEWLEEWSRINATGVVENIATKEELDKLRAAWITGQPMREILAQTDNADKICKETYGFQLPWLIHAAGQQIKQMGNEGIYETLSSIALLVELGLSSETAACIFLAGVRSRASATEIAACSVRLGNTPAAVRRKLKDPEILDQLRQEVSEQTRAWLELHLADSARETFERPNFSRFKLKKIDSNTVLVRNYDENTYLCSPDGRQRMAVKVTDKLPFDQIADDYRFAFQKAADGRYDLITRDPRRDAEFETD